MSSVSENRRVVGSRIEIRPGVHRIFASAGVKADGSRYRPSTTFHGTDTEAERAMHRFCDQVSRRRPYELDKQTLSIAEFYPDWKRLKSTEVRRNTLIGYDQKYRLYIAPRWGKVKADRIEPHGCKLWIADLRKTPKKRQPEEGVQFISESTVHAAYVVFDMMLDEMVMAGYLDSNPLKRVSVKPPKPGPVSGTLTQAEVEAYLAAFRGSPVEAFVLTDLGTGGRRSEIAALSWSDFRFWSADGTRLGSINITHGLYQYGGDVWEDATKTEKSAATVMIVPRFVPRLMELRGVGPIAPDGGGAMKPDKIARVYRATVEKAGLRYVPLQRLRHSFAMLALDADVPLRVVQEWLRHTSSRTTERYVAASIERQVAVAPDLVKKWGTG